MSSTFDSLRKQALMRRANAADSPWQNFPALGNKMTQELPIFKIDVSDFFRTKFAHPFAPDTEPFRTWHCF